MTALEVRDLVVRYGDIQVVHGVDFYVEPGEVVAILGSNGMGKSTTLLSVAGLLPATTGALVLEGETVDLTVRRPRGLSERGLVLSPEERQLFGGLTVMENLLLGGLPHRGLKQVREDMEEVFDIFPVLAERRQQRAGTMSGGEQQMLTIGRSMMARPSVLLLDEPSLGLAPMIVQTVLDSVRRIVERTATAVVLVEQSVVASLGSADRGYLMVNGRFVLEGTSEELREDDRVRELYLGA